jgi:hypothetical protein
MLPCLMIAKHNPPISSFPSRLSLPGVYPGPADALSSSNLSPVDSDLSALRCELSASSLSPFNFKPSTLNPVTFLDAASSVSPLSAALTKTPGVGAPHQAHAFSAPDRCKRLSPVPYLVTSSLGLSLNPLPRLRALCASRICSYPRVQPQTTHPKPPSPLECAVPQNWTWPHF